MDQIELPPHLLDGYMESNVPPNSYATMLKCGLGNSPSETMQSPCIASPRPLTDLGELEVSGNTQVDRYSPPGDVHGEEDFKAISYPDGVSTVCLSYAIPAEDETLSKNDPAGSREGMGHDVVVDHSFSRLVVDAQPPPSDAVFLFDDRTSSGAEVQDHDSIVPPFDEVVSKMVPTLEVDLDLTPSSITRLLSKYSLDASSIGGADTISPRGSLADVRHGRALDASRVIYYSAKDVIAMQYGPWKPAKSQRQRKSAPKNSKRSSGT